MSFFRYKVVYFTLLEMLIAIGILLSATAVLGISIYKAVEEQRFRSEVGRVVEQLRLAQDLMLMFNLDINVVFKKDPEGKGIRMSLTTDNPLHPRWSQFFKRRELLLQATKHALWITALESKPLEQDVKIAFTAKGLLMNRGVIRLSAKSDTNFHLTRDILLQGYPAPIRSQLPIENPFNKEMEEADFNEKFIEVTRRENEEIKKETKQTPEKTGNPA